MIQLFVPVWTSDVFYDCIRTLPVPVIADHSGGTLGASKLPPQLQDIPLSQPGFSSLLTLAKQFRLFIKISGLYRVFTRSESHFDDTQPIIQALAREVPNQLIWGSDWPHTGDGSNRLNRDINVKEPFRAIDNEAILRNIRSWVTDEAWQRMLMDNPGYLPVTSSLDHNYL